ncbi:MAG: DMT family transporter [Gemmatimonadales bacterium]
MSLSLGESATPGRERAARPGAWLTELSLVGMALIWGVNFSVVKFGTSVIDPLAYNGVRVMLAGLLLTGIVVARRMPLPSRRVSIALLGLGVLGNGIYQVFFIEGIARTRASDAALVIAATPAFIAVIGRVRGVERVATRGAFGIALSIAGIALVVLGSTTGKEGQGTVLGDLLVLFGALCWAAYTVLLKPYTERVGGLQLSAFTMMGGALPLFAAAWPAVSHAPWRSLPTMGWLAIVYSGVFALVIAYLIWYNGVRVIGPTRTSMYSNLQPLVAVLVAWPLLGEIPTAWQIVGATCIMGGLVLTRA